MLFRFVMISIFFLPIAACKYDETISGYIQKDTIWTLVELNGTPFSKHATISFPSKGKVIGHAPCNSYSATQTAPLPWFELIVTEVTELECSDLKAEGMFFQGLESMTQAEVLNTVLILSNETGSEMVFRSFPK